MENSKRYLNCSDWFYYKNSKYIASVLPIRNNKKPFPANIEGDCPLSYVANCHIIYDCSICWSINYPNRNKRWKRNEA